MGVSALVQFCTLTVLLIVPLFATGSRLILHQTNFVPLPPYGGGPKPNAANTQRATLPPTHGPRPEFHFPQIQAPTQRPIETHQLWDTDAPGAADFPRTVLGLQGAGSGLDGPPGILDVLSDKPGPQPPRPENNSGAGSGKTDHRKSGEFNWAAHPSRRTDLSELRKADAPRRHGRVARNNRQATARCATCKC